MRKSIFGLIAACIAAPALAAPVGATAPVEVRAKVVRPLMLTSTGSLNFGTIILNGLTANRTVSLSTTNIRDCGGGTAELVCSGATSVPTYNVRGTNNQTATIIKTATNLVNAANGATLSMTPIGPASITFTNSSNNGVNFTIGASITLTPSTGDGLYSGSVDVQVEYQ